MDISNGWAAAKEVADRIKQRKLVENLEGARSPKGFEAWKESFIEFFQSLQAREKKILIFLREYEPISFLYGKIKRPDIQAIRQEDVIVIKGMFDRLNGFIQSTQGYARKDMMWEPNSPVLTIIFPITAKEDTSETLANELNWFLKVLNRAHSEMSSTGQQPVVQQVDNVDVAVSIAVDWQFMLVTLGFLAAIGRHISNSYQKKNALDALRELGVSQENISKVEHELNPDGAIDFENAMKTVSDAVSNAGDGSVTSALAAYFARLREADAKRYRFGFDLPTSETLRKITTGQSDNAPDPSLIQHVVKLTEERRTEEAEQVINATQATPIQRLEDGSPSL